MKFLKRYGHFALFLLFLVKFAGYFGTQQGGLSFMTVHMAVDDLIPFLPIFIIPYMIWYVYVPAPMVYLAFTDKQAFIRQCITFFSGVGVALVCFFLLPTTIDFRPTAEGDGIWLALTRFIYANDQPVNVCPSLHCYEAVMVHLTAFRASGLRHRRMLRLLSAVLVVLICLSTVFIKQHAALDVICGVGLAVFVYGIFYGIVWRERI